MRSLACRGRYHGGRRPSSEDSFHSPTVIPPSALDKPSIMKHYHRRQTTRWGVTARSPTMVTLHGTRFVECRRWNDCWTVKTVLTWRSSASMIPAPSDSWGGCGLSWAWTLPLVFVWLTGSRGRPCYTVGARARQGIYKITPFWSFPTHTDPRRLFNASALPCSLWKTPLISIETVKPVCVHDCY